MTSLKETQEVTSQIKELADQLEQEIGEGEGDFEKMIQLCEQISSQADGLAGTFGTINAALMQRLQGAKEGSKEQETATAGKKS